jgi:hypothetical protein
MFLTFCRALPINDYIYNQYVAKDGIGLMGRNELESAGLTFLSPVIAVIHSSSAALNVHCAYYAT